MIQLGKQNHTFFLVFALIVLIISACSPNNSTPTQEPVIANSNAPILEDEEETTLAIEEDVVWIANGMDDNLTAIALNTGEVLTTLPVGINPHILDASADGRILYVINAGEHDRDPNAHADGNDDHHGNEANTGEHINTSVEANSLWAIDTKTGTTIAQVPVGMGPTHPIPSQDGRWVYVTNTDAHSVSVIDTNTWQVIATISDLAEPHDGAVTPDGQFLYVATSDDNTLTVIDTTTQQVVETFPVGQKPRGVIVGGQDGEIAYVTNKGDDTLTIIDVAGSQIVGTYPVGDGPHALRMHPNGQYIYITLSKEDAVVMVDAQTGEVVNKIAVGKLPEQIDLSSNGQWLFASNNGDNTLSIIDLETNEVIHTIKVGQGAYGVQAILTSETAPVTTIPNYPKNEGGFADITVSQLSDLMSANHEVTLINVHIPYAGDIPNTDLSIPFNEIASYTNQLPNKEAPLVIYCRSGNMSTQAAQALVNLGYTNVMEVDGGMRDWESNGYKLIYQP